jgi:hypothetical protein
MTAGSGIGSQGQVLKTDMQDGTLNAVTSAGNVYLVEKDGSLTVGTVASHGYGDVFIQADLDILAGGGSSLIKGGRVDLVSNFGGIGTSGQDVRTDVGDGILHGLTATAMNSIYLNEVNGDLQLINAESKGGDVAITVSTGTLLDANNEEESIHERA